MTAPYSIKNFDIFDLSKKLVLAAYALTGTLPPEEKTALTQYIRQAALCTHFSVAQGAFLRKKKRRRKFSRKAMDSLIVMDAAVDVLLETGLATADATGEVQQLSSTCYGLLSRLQKGN